MKEHSMRATKLDHCDAAQPTPVDSLMPVARSEHPPPTPARGAGRSRARAAAWGATAIAVFLSGGVGARAHGQTPADVQVRAGAPQIKTSDSGAPQRWKQREVVVSVDDSVTALGPDMNAAVEGAFAAWTNANAQLPTFRFDRTNGVTLRQKPDGRNTVSVAEIDVEGHTKDVALTISFTDSNTGEILEEDIFLNARYVFKTLPADIEATALSELLRELEPNGHGAPSVDGPLPTASTVSSYGLGSVSEVCGKSYDAQNALTHEVGHFLGLGEDKQVADSTMYYRITPCETHKRVLKSDDAATVRDVYKDGFADPVEVRCQAAGAGRGLPLGRGVGWMAAFVGMGLVGLRRRRAA
jgi:hypothetical protein